jgi:uncharacterized protein YdaU (DUF1376 family)
MHSYPFYIDDWRSSDAVAAMTAEERGIYRELIDQCWREGSLPVSDRALQNFARATDKEWKRSRKAVLACFYEEAGRLFSTKVSDKRAEIIEKKEERAERNKANGLAGGRKKKPRENPVGFEMEPTQNPDGTPSPSPSPSPSPYTEESRLREKNNNIGVFVVEPEPMPELIPEPEPMPRCADDCPVTYALLTSPEAWRLSPIPASRVIAAAMGELILPDEQLASVVREIWLAGGRSAKTPQGYITRVLPEQLIQMRQQYQALLADKRTGQQDRQMILARLPERFKARGVPGGTRKGESSSLEQAGAVQGGIQPGVLR